MDCTELTKVWPWFVVGCVVIFVVHRSSLDLCIYKVYTYFMTTKIQKWGNSLGVRLPKALFENGQFTEGSVVRFEQKDKEIILKITEEKRPTLKEVLRV